MQIPGNFSSKRSGYHLYNYHNVIAYWIRLDFDVNKVEVENYYITH